MSICYTQKDGNASIYAHAVLEISFDFVLNFLDFMIISSLDRGYNATTEGIWDYLPNMATTDIAMVNFTVLAEANARICHSSVVADNEYKVIAAV